MYSTPRPLSSCLQMFADGAKRLREDQREEPTGPAFSQSPSLPSSLLYTHTVSTHYTEIHTFYYRIIKAVARDNQPMFALNRKQQWNKYDLFLYCFRNTPIRSCVDADSALTAFLVLCFVVVFLPRTSAHFVLF